MSWPTVTVSTTHMDQDSDIVVLARPAIKQMADNVNAIKDAITVNTFTDDQTLYYDSATQTVKARTLSGVEIGWTKQQYFDQSTLTAATNVSWNLQTQQTATLTLSQNVTIDNPTNQQAGATYVVMIKQDATGGRTVAWDTDYLFADGVTPTITTTANAVDLIIFYSDGTKMYGSQLRDFS